jgi:HK97 family phage major capsid protein
MAHEETREELAQEIAALKSDISRLKEDVEAALSTAGTLSKDKLQDAKDKLRAAMESIQARVKQSLSAAYAGAREHGKEAVDKSRQTIVQNPFLAVGGAFLAGVVLAMLIGRGRHGHSD